MAVVTTRVRAGRGLAHAVVACAAVALAAPSAARAQATPPLLLVPHGDSVRLFLTSPPPAGGGFVVYRSSAGEAATRVTPAPVEPIRDAQVAAISLGDGLQTVMVALAVEDEFSMLRRLDSDPFAAGLLSLLRTDVAVMLGRTWAEGGLTPGVEYDYRVVFTNGMGAESGPSLAGSVRMTDVLPRTPTAVAAAPGEGVVSLTWEYPRHQGNTDDVVIGFNVYRSIGDARPERVTPSPIVRDELADPLYEDRAVMAGATYRYEVRAVDVVGREGPPAAAAPVTLADRRGPAAPEELVATGGDGAVLLVWRISPELDAAGYHVERSPGLDQPWTRITAAPLAVDAPAFADTTAVGGTQVFYRVVALDRAGNESFPGNPVGALPMDRRPPAPPSGLSGAMVRQADGKRTLTLSWSASPSSDVAGYELWRGEVDGRSLRMTDELVVGTTWTDLGAESAGLPPGRTYWIRVAAVDGSDNVSPFDSAIVVVPDDEAPDAPSVLDAQNPHGRAVELGWAESGSFDVVAYLLERVEPSGAVVPLGRFPVPGARVARDTLGLRRGQTYGYRVAAVDTAGNVGRFTEASVRFRDFVAPSAPRAATAEVTAAGVELRWERVVDDDLAGYHVYRSDLPTGVYERLTTAPVQTLLFLDGGPARDLWYVVRAVDGSGNESAESPPARGGG